MPGFSSSLLSILAPHMFLTSLMLGGALLGARVASAQTITRDVWTGISGNSVTAIPVTRTPNSTGTLTRFEAPSNVADNYGQRVRGYLTAPTTGSYTFWIAGDDNCELWLSTNKQASNKVRIAYHTGWTYSRRWQAYSTQKSAAIKLQAGQQYYIEALMKEGDGSDCLAVGWAKPGQATTAPSEIIPGSVLSPFVKMDDVTPTSDIGPLLPGGRFSFAYPHLSPDAEGVASPEKYVTRFAGAKHNPSIFDQWAASGHDIRTLNPKGMYFKHINLRALDSTQRGATGSKVEGRPDYDWIHANHPEWIIKDVTGKTVSLFLPTEEVLDFGNDDYLDWVVNTWMPQQLFDSTDLAAPVIYLQHDNGDFRGQTQVSCAATDAACNRYRTDEGVQSAWVNMLNKIRQRWPQVRIIISTGPYTYIAPATQMAAFQRVLSAAHGYYSEGLTDRHSYWKSVSPSEKRVALETTMELASWLSVNDKIFMPIEGQGDGIALTQDDTDYAFAFFNLLRTSSDKQFFSKLTTIGSEEGNVRWVPAEYPEMFLPLGAPTEEPTQISPNVYRRNFERAVAYVNLSDVSTTIDLSNSKLKNSRGIVVATITLKSFSGITLYR